jgi:hypothetical protein
MRKQYREPETELAPLEYVVAERQREEAEKRRQAEMTAGMPELMPEAQGAGPYDGM